MEDIFTIAIISANRPKYLKRTLESLKKQIPADMINTNIVLYQDGIEANGIEIIPKETVDKCIKIFENIFPEGYVELSTNNLWINHNVKRALDMSYEKYKSSGVILLEDDVILSKWAIGVQKALMYHTRENDKVVAVSAASDTGVIPLEFQNKNKTKPTNLRRVFFMGMWKLRWKWLFSVTNGYYDIPGNMFRNNRQLANKKTIDIMKNIGSGHTITGHDGLWNSVIHMNNKTWLSSNTVNAIHIGEHGIHCTTKMFDILGKNSISFDKDFRDFNFTNEDINNIAEINKKRISI